MAEASNSPPPAPRPDLPSLREIQAEGDRATLELARAFVRETLKAGGRIDLARLQRAGPAVVREYQRQLERIALRTLAPATVAPDPKGTSKLKPTARQTSTTHKPSQEALPRVEKGWSNQRCAAPSFVIAARRRGLIVGAVATIAALAVAALFHL